MSEQHVAAQFDNIATVTHVKLIRDKSKGTPVGYGFVEFSDAQTAKEIFENLNGKPIPGSNKVFKLNWASHGGGVARATPPPHQVVAPTIVPQFSHQEHQVYVGDLDNKVTNNMLL